MSRSSYWRFRSAEMFARKYSLVITAPGHGPGDALVRELQDHVKRLTGPYKYPRRIEFVDDLPKTASGKLQRNLLRAREFSR